MCARKRSCGLGGFRDRGVFCDVAGSVHAEFFGKALAAAQEHVGVEKFDSFSMETTFF